MILVEGFGLVRGLMTSFPKSGQMTPHKKSCQKNVPKRLDQRFRIS